MKKFYLSLLILICSFKTIQAQYFIGDITFSGNVAIFSVKAQGGDITNKLSVVEYFIRWDQSEGNSFSFSSIINNETDFPGMNIVTANNDVSDDGYNNQHFYFVGLTDAARTYTDGTSYEMFRTTMSNIPSAFQLVANNNTGVPYYFTVQGDGGTDYTPYGLSPFVSATGSSGSFYYKTFSFTPLPIALKSFSGKAVDCNASLEWITSNEINSSYFEIQQSSDGQKFVTVANVKAVGNSGIDNRYAKSVSLTTPLNYYRIKMVDKDGKLLYSKVIMINGDPCNLSFIVQVVPNPIINHEARLLVSAAKEDNLDIKLMDMAGTLIGNYTRHAGSGINTLIIHLPLVASGQYLLKITSSLNGSVDQKIFIQ